METKKEESRDKQVSLTEHQILLALLQNWISYIDTRNLLQPSVLIRKCLTGVPLGNLILSQRRMLTYRLLGYDIV
jgi:hypothetical protein